MINIDSEISIEHNMHMVSIESDTSAKIDRSQNSVIYKNNPGKFVKHITNNGRIDQANIKSM